MSRTFFSSRPIQRQTVAVYWPYSSKRHHDQAKREADKQTKNAIRSGLLIRSRCEECGSSKAEAHHDDYAKPLEVRWLCRKHHRAHHRRAGVTPSQKSAPIAGNFLTCPATLPLVKDTTTRLLQMIEAEGINESQLAARTGSSRQYINTLSHGGVRTLKVVAALADALGYDVSIHFEKRDELSGVMAS